MNAAVNGYAVPFDSDVMAFNFDGEDMKKMNEYFKSDEWKDKVKMLKDMKVESMDVSDLDFDFPIPPTPPNAPNAPKLRIYKFKDLDFKGIRDKKWSPEEIAKISEKTKGAMETAKQRADFEKKRSELEKKRAKLNEKRMKLEGERAKLEAERRVLEGSNNRVYIYNDNIAYNVAKSPNTMSFHADVMKKDRDGNVTMNGVKGFKYDDLGDMKIYIDSKEVTKKELDELGSNNIKSININKKTSDGKTSGEIRIKTK